jgi:hypothetical protein
MNAEVDVLNDHIQQAIEIAKQHGQQTAEVDVWQLLQRTALVSVAAAFDQSFEMVKGGQHPLPKAISNDLSMSALRASTAGIPIISTLVDLYLKYRRSKQFDIGKVCTVT